MKNNNNGRYAAEKKLFHGTDPKFVDAICYHNFDWRKCGTNGTVYGEGKFDKKTCNCMFILSISWTTSKILISYSISTLVASGIAACHSSKQRLTHTFMVLKLSISNVTYFVTYTVPYI